MKSSGWVIGATIVLMTIISSNLNWTRDHWQYILEADAKGYYAYLPAVFIYDDLNFGFFKEIELDKYHHDDLFFDYRAEANGKKINKYYCGTAVSQLPFFLIAHLFTWLSDKATDGYSYWYPVMINVAGLFYLLLGLLCINRILTFFEVSPRYRSWALVAMVFGTNLFYYTVGEPGMSHIFSFGWIALFLLAAFEFFRGQKTRWLLILSFALGMIVLIRPINILILLAIPFVAGSSKSLMQCMKYLLLHKWQTLLSLLLAGMVVSTQLIIYKISTGHFLAYSYEDEGFHFLDPHFFEILFSYKKGLFLYTPMYLVALLGLFFFYKKDRYRALSFIAFLLLLTYVLSSWCVWYYGGSFSSRVYVDYIPFFVIPLSIALKELHATRLRFLLPVLISLLVIVCQIQTYQYRYYEIHWSEMNKEKYWNIFLRIDRLL